MYGHPESYPPTLNAITCLAEQYEIKVICRAHQASVWPYPADVEILLDGAVLSASQQENLPVWRKVRLFLRFCILFWKTWWQFNPQIVLFYDSLSILAYCLGVRIKTSNPILWYHNHDVCEPNLVRKYSLTWWSLRAERWIFPKLSIFSLPALDRKTYFPMDQLKGKFFFLPNYPAKKVYQTHFNPNKDLKDIRILYQGQLSPNHGIEELLAMMPFTIHDKAVKLILRGHARNNYDQWLNQQIEERGLKQFVEVHEFTPYKDIPRLGSLCHIGLAVFTKQDIMNRTIGTASNKIYEYAALGLPILYFDSPYFRRHLEQYKWAIPSDLSCNSLKNAIHKIITEYAHLSHQAYHDFTTTLNFEHHFRLLLNQLNLK